MNKYPDKILNEADACELSIKRDFVQLKPL